MKSKMKLYEKMALDYAKKFPNWDLHIIAKDAYLRGIQDVTDANIAYTSRIDEVEVEFPDGEHQLSNRTFEKWRKQ